MARTDRRLADIEKAKVEVLEHCRVR
jgi:hypothetical protein